MFNSNLFEVWIPVGAETCLLFAQWVVFIHDVLNAAFKAHLEFLVVLVAGPNYGFVVGGILHFHLRCNLILDALFFGFVTG